MRETYLIISGALIVPTLDGRKTQTRRLPGLERVNEAPDEWGFLTFGRENKNGKENRRSSAARGQSVSANKEKRNEREGGHRLGAGGMRVL